jgi:hypothetical protein
MSHNNRKRSHRQWFNWLKQATNRKGAQALRHVYSDGRQLAAAREESLHACRLSLRKQGRVVLSHNNQMVVEANFLPPLPFAKTLSPGEPVAAIVVRRTRLMQALAGQGDPVRLRLYAAGNDNLVVELASADVYALVLTAWSGKGTTFWRPEFVVEEGA